MIDVINLSKSYGNLKAVDKISFKVGKGEIFAFLGPNGAGKSTTIKMLTTLLRPTKGEIKINGFDPQTQAYQVRRSFGIVFQDASLDDELTAWENLELHGVLYGLCKDLRKKRIKEMLDFVQLEERKNTLVKTFSGGMKRRLEIARGLLHHPKIFFLDEPTLGLDPQTRNNIWSYLKNLNKEKRITIFFTTHYMEEAERVAGKIAVIDHGQIIAQGSPQALKKQTKTVNLEEAFLNLTGRKIREEGATTLDRMRMQHQMHGRKR